MKLTLSTAALAAGLLAASAHASATTLTFEDLTPGTVLSNQYTALGATFVANAFTGAGSATSVMPWATNTDMGIVDSLGADAGGLGGPAGVVSGNILHNFSNWLNENGDPSFRIDFSAPMNFFSAAFGGVSTPADVTIWAYNGATLLGSVSGSTAGQFVLSFSAPSITSIAVRPGSFDDWVGVDNVTFTPAVPEPASYAMLGVGIGLLALRRRSRG